MTTFWFRAGLLILVKSVNAALTGVCIIEIPSPEEQ